MNSWKLAYKRFRHNWRVNLAVIMGAAISTAVLAGALIVGDSVTGSLRYLATDRLGKIDEVLIADHFFDSSLGKRLESQPLFQENFRQAVPTILLPQSSAEFDHEDGVHRASSVNLIGSTDGFWQQNQPSGILEVELASDEVIINQPLADELRAHVGDEIVLRFAKESNIATDSPLADSSEMGRTLAEMKVKQIVPAEGLGRFSINPSQHSPLCAFVPLLRLQRSLEQPGKSECDLDFR